MSSTRCTAPNGTLSELVLLLSFVDVPCGVAWCGAKSYLFFLEKKRRKKIGNMLLIAVSILERGLRALTDTHSLGR